MIGNASFRRKVLYGVLIAVLLIPLSFISRPSTRQADGSVSGGGILSQMRSKNRLSQAELGEIDPTSESMKLATLGMRGVAANLLWERAHKYKREQDWDNLSATLNQISKLQPNFISVWQFQGWNLAYNVSVEFDDYRSRYHWVKKGIDFLREGVEKNHQEPVLYWELGWTFGHKLGKADEYVQFRRLYSDDEDYHYGEHGLAEDINMDETKNYQGKPDNWLTGRQWFLQGQSIVDSGVDIRGRLLDDTGRIKRGKTPLIFHSNPAKWVMNYAMAIQEEGILGEISQLAWRDAGEEWHEFGDRPIESSLESITIRLNDVPALQRQLDSLFEELIKQAESDYGIDIQSKILAEKMDALLPEERAALDTPAEDRTDEQRQLVSVAKRKMEIKPEEIAQRAPPNVRRRTEELAQNINFTRAKLQTTQSYQEQVAFPYWAARCEIEQTDDAMRARRFMFDADKLIDSAALTQMKELYENAWEEWAKIYARYPHMVEAPDAEDIYDAILRYKFVMEKLDEPWPPKGFKLNAIMEYYDDTYRPHPDDESNVEGSNVEGSDVETSNDETSNDETLNDEASNVETSNGETAGATKGEPALEGTADDESPIDIPN